jgi:DNA-binding GntR family transcriptional regulator
MTTSLEPQGQDFVTKRQFAADWLRETIISGEFPPGHRVRQQVIADRLGVSATPIREAIWQLDSEGYLESVPHVGFRVVRPREDSFEEVFELRVLLEGRITRASAATITDADVERIEELSRLFEVEIDAEDAMAARRQNYRLHCAIWDIADQPVTRAIANSLWSKVPWDTLDDVAGRGRLSVIEHKAIIDALTARDGDAAEGAMHRHIQSSYRSWH